MIHGKAGSHHETGSTSLLQATSTGAHVLHYYKGLEALESSWELKKKNPTKTKQNPRACCHHYESREHKSTAQQTHQLSAEIFLLHAGFPSFVTFAQFNSRQVCKAQVSRIRGKLCQKSITRWQPKARFCMCPEQDGNVNARGSKAPLQGKQPLYKAHQAGSGSVPCESRV